MPKAIAEPATLPILYSLQYCPYAMRARLGLLLAEQTVAVRAVTMLNKPKELFQASAKGTVPVLVVDVKTVVDESIDIMLWALNRNDPNNLLLAKHADALPEMLQIIKENDTQFKSNLEKYKLAKRFHHDSEQQDRLVCEPFIHSLESRLSNSNFLMGVQPSLLDYALLPFVRQFAKVSRQLFREGPYTNLRSWLEYHLQSQLFATAMRKYPFWIENPQMNILGDGPIGL